MTQDFDILTKLRENWPSMYDQVKDVEMAPLNYRLVTAQKADEPLLEVNREGRWVPLYSKFDPIHEAGKWSESIEVQPTNIIMFGFGLGYHYQALSKRFPSASFYIVEPDPQLFFKYVEANHLKPKTLKNIKTFLISSNVEIYKEFFKNILHVVDERWLILSLPKFERVYSEAFGDFREAFKKAKKKYLDATFSLSAFEKVWDFNVLENLPNIYGTPNIFEYQDHFEGKTVVLTASGPSLNEGMPFIQRVKSSKKALIVSAGTSINALVNKGILPDLFVSYDPFIANYESLKGVMNQKIPFVFGTAIHPKIPSVYCGPMAHVYASSDHLSHYFNPDIDKNTVISDGPTVTAIALDLLYKLGAKEVFLIGQDLCYIDSKVGAEGVYFYNKEGHVNDDHLKDQLYVETNNGQMALTNRSFIQMKDFIEELISGMDGRMNMYSISLNGAKIQGMSFCEISDAEKRILMNTPLEGAISFHEKETSPSVHEAMYKLKRDVDFYNELTQTLDRQIVKFQEAAENQKRKWQMKMNSTLSRLTNKEGYDKMIYPLIANRIHYLIRLQSNSNFNDLNQVTHYFNEGLAPLIKELKQVIKKYVGILSNFFENQVEINEFIQK